MLTQDRPPSAFPGSAEDRANYDRCSEPRVLFECGESVACSSYFRIVALVTTDHNRAYAEIEKDGASQYIDLTWPTDNAFLRIAPVTWWIAVYRSRHKSALFDRERAAHHMFLIASARGHRHFKDGARAQVPTPPPAAAPVATAPAAARAAPPKAAPARVVKPIDEPLF